MDERFYQYINSFLGEAWDDNLEDEDLFLWLVFIMYLLFSFWSESIDTFYTDNSWDGLMALFDVCGWMAYWNCSNQLLFYPAIILTFSKSSLIILILCSIGIILTPSLPLWWCHSNQFSLGVFLNSIEYLLFIKDSVTNYLLWMCLCFSCFKFVIVFEIFSRCRYLEMRSRKNFHPCGLLSSWNSN